jgi:hypothetical protein
MEKSQSFDDWAQGNFSKATGFSKEQLPVSDAAEIGNSPFCQPNFDRNDGGEGDSKMQHVQSSTAACEPESDPVPGVATPSRNVSSTSVLGGAEDEWPRRHEKRKRIVLTVKTSPEYRVMVDLRAEGKLQIVPPSTPNAYDPDISKRKWEESVKVWRDELRQLVK